MKHFYSALNLARSQLQEGRQWSSQAVFARDALKLAVERPSCWSADYFEHLKTWYADSESFIQQRQKLGAAAAATTTTTPNHTSSGSRALPFGAMPVTSQPGRLSSADNASTHRPDRIDLVTGVSSSTMAQRASGGYNIDVNARPKAVASASNLPQHFVVPQTNYNYNNGGTTAATSAAVVAAAAKPAAAKAKRTFSMSRYPFKAWDESTIVEPFSLRHEEGNGSFNVRFDLDAPTIVKIAASRALSPNDVERGIDGQGRSYSVRLLIFTEGDDEYSLAVSVLCC